MLARVQDGKRYRIEPPGAIYPLCHPPPDRACSSSRWQDITDSSLRVITQHRSPSPPSRRRLSERLSTRLKDAITCLSTSKDSDGDGTPDCLDQCPYDPNAHAAKDCPITLDVFEQPVEERLIVTVDHAIATEVLLEVIFGQHQAIIGPVTATSRDEAGSHWSLSVHTPGWHKGDPFTVRAKTFTLSETWSPTFDVSDANRLFRSPVGVTS